MVIETNGDDAAADADHLVAHVVAVGKYDALRDVGNQLAAALWSRQEATNDPAVATALQHERRAVDARVRSISPDSDQVEATLEAWGARLRALRAP
jgi:hypothetical protein